MHPGAKPWWPCCLSAAVTNVLLGRAKGSKPEAEAEETPEQRQANREAATSGAEASAALAKATQEQVPAPDFQELENWTMDMRISMFACLCCLLGSQHACKDYPAETVLDTCSMLIGSTTLTQLFLA